MGGWTAATLSAAPRPRSPQSLTPFIYFQGPFHFPARSLFSRRASLLTWASCAWTALQANLYHSIQGWLPRCRRGHRRCRAGGEKSTVQEGRRVEQERGDRHTSRRSGMPQPVPLGWGAVGCDVVACFRGRPQTTAYNAGLAVLEGEGDRGGVRASRARVQVLFRGAPQGTLFDVLLRGLCYGEDERCFGSPKFHGAHF